VQRRVRVPFPCCGFRSGDRSLQSRPSLLHAPDHRFESVKSMAIHYIAHPHCSVISGPTNRGNLLVLMSQNVNRFSHGV
jgi:hypothetical protein